MSQDDFPTRVRAERKQRGWTQKQLASETSVSVRTIQMIEAGQSSGTPTHRRAIMSALGMGEPAETAAAEGMSNGACPECGEQVWPNDVKAFRNMIGAYLMTLPEERRIEVILDLTRQIFEGNR